LIRSVLGVAVDHLKLLHGCPDHSRFEVNL
jgi:hypothetical protein